MYELDSSSSMFRTEMIRFEFPSTGTRQQSSTSFTRTNVAIARLCDASAGPALGILGPGPLVFVPLKGKDALSMPAKREWSVKVLFPQRLSDVSESAAPTGPPPGAPSHPPYLFPWRHSPSYTPPSAYWHLPWPCCSPCCHSPVYLKSPRCVESSGRACEQGSIRTYLPASCQPRHPRRPQRQPRTRKKTPVPCWRSSL